MTIKTKVMTQVMSLPRSLVQPLFEANMQLYK